MRGDGGEEEVLVGEWVEGTLTGLATEMEKEEEGEDAGKLEDLLAGKDVDGDRSAC